MWLILEVATNAMSMAYFNTSGNASAACTVLKRFCVLLDHHEKGVKRLNDAGWYV